MLSTKSKFLVDKGQSIRYDWYDFPNGSRYIVGYKESFYYIVDDGTGNNFFHHGNPVKISESEAKEILSEYQEAWEKARKLFGWEPLEEYFEKML